MSARSSLSAMQPRRRRGEMLLGNDTIVRGALEAGVASRQAIRAFSEVINNAAHSRAGHSSNTP
jgi:hypothetical protein